LKDGDVLLKRSSGSVANRIISGFTGSPYTHAALYSKGKVYDSLGKIGTAERKNVKIGGNIRLVAQPKNPYTLLGYGRNCSKITQTSQGRFMSRVEKKLKWTDALLPCKF
jgi:hypothetical protein